MLVHFEEDRSYAKYFSDVSNARMPANALEEQDLFRKYHEKGDQDARRRIIEGGLRFVVKIAKRYYRGDSEFLKNLIAAGNVGLVTAVDRYCPWVIRCLHCHKPNYVATPKFQRCTECGHRLQHQRAERYTTRFLTYAAWWISEAIRTELYESSLVHIPPYKQKEHHRARQEGQEVGLTYYSFDDLLDQDTNTDHGTYKHDKLMQQALDTTASNREEEVLMQHAIDLLHALLRSMKDRQAYVVITYYGLREEPKTLREIAEKLGVCPERVRQIKEDALQELKMKLMRLNVRHTSDIFLN